ncbi:MAG: S-layer homology domain-containing protein [Chthonomonadales bacterium]|nr:S-layer homology domain-containing protein [Chthonomonadales bacterium]
MKIGIVVVACAAGLGLMQAARAQSPSDVPQGHWARSAVEQVVRAGIMPAPGGRFAGSQVVTRKELVPVLYRLARVLELRKWPSAAVRPVTAPKAPGWRAKPVTRYTLAAVVARVAPMVLKGLPPSAGKVFGQTEGLPAPATVKGLPAGSPLSTPLKYLAANRMVWPGSPLLKPGTQTVTGEQLAAALGELVAGLDDRLTDEPQNRPDLGEPPAHKH